MADAGTVIETLIVLVAVATLCGISWAATLLPPDALLTGGGLVTALGLLLGVPTGFWYHVALYRALRPRGPLPARWWLHPVPLHEQLEESQRSAVLRWFVAGGLGFVVVVAGCTVVVLGLVLIVFGRGV